MCTRRWERMCKKRGWSICEPRWPPSRSTWRSLRSSTGAVSMTIIYKVGAYARLRCWSPSSSPAGHAPPMLLACKCACSHHIGITTLRYPPSSPTHSCQRATTPPTCLWRRPHLCMHFTVPACVHAPFGHDGLKYTCRAQGGHPREPGLPRAVPRHVRQYRRRPARLQQGPVGAGAAMLLLRCFDTLSQFLGTFSALQATRVVRSLLGCSCCTRRLISL